MTVYQHIDNPAVTQTTVTGSRLDKRYAAHPQWRAVPDGTVPEPPAPPADPGPAGPPDPLAGGEVPASEVPDGTVPEVLDWVRGAPDGDEPTEGWLARARAALDVETAELGQGRKGIIEPLSELLG